jgi:hypothetical protein
MNAPNKYKVQETSVEVRETLPVVTTDKPFTDMSDVTIYANDQLIVYLEDEQHDLRGDFDEDFIKNDLLGEVDNDWKDKYCTKICPEDVSETNVLLISPDRMARHTDGTEPFTALEMPRYRALRMCVRLHPRTKPRPSPAVRKLKRQRKAAKARERFAIQK